MTSINQRSDLDAGAIGKRGEKDKTAAEPKTKADLLARAGDEETSGPGSGSRADIARMFGEILSGENYHENLRDLPAYFAKTGMDIGACMNLMYGAMDASEGPHDERWEARRNNPDGNDTQGVYNLVTSAYEKYAEEKEAEEVTSPEIEAAASRDLFLEDLRKQPVTKLRFIVEDFVLAGALNGFFGDGATGKDLLLEHLCIAMAMEEAEWLGRKVTPGKSIYMPCEDDAADRRQDNIEQYLREEGQFHPVKRRMKIRPMVGEDTVLAVFDHKKGLVKPTKQFDILRRTIGEFEPAVTVVGNRVNIFAVNQNDDAQARQCMSLLSSLCRDFGTAVIMPAHPSLGGIGSGTGTSGSVQWNNACRLRAYLSRIKTDDGKREPNPNRRQLEVLKSNWSATGKLITMEWDQGVLKTDHASIEKQKAETGKTGRQIEEAQWLKVENEFMRMLALATAKLTLVSPNPTARNFAPTVFSRNAECAYRDRSGYHDLKAAMDRLYDKNAIKSVEYGPPSDRRPKIERAK